MQSRLLWAVLTVFDVRRSDSTNSRPVVRNPFRGFDVFIVDAFPKVVDDGDSR